MLLAIAQLLLLLAAGAAACEEGCKAAEATVCGSDGLTYMNECLAACQGVTVRSTGSCMGSHHMDPDTGSPVTVSAIHIPAELFAQAVARDVVDGEQAVTSEAAVLSQAAITAYQAEGMRMVGMLKRSYFDPAMPLLSEDDVASTASLNAAASTTVMVNSQGHLYAVPPGSKAHGPAASLQNGLLLTGQPRTDPDSPSEATAPLLAENESLDSQDLAEDEETVDVMAGQGGAEGGAESTGTAAAKAQAQTVKSSSSSSSSGKAGGSRKLRAIFGDDTREEVRAAPRYPLSASGHLMFVSPSNGQTFQCTGTLIGTYAVLTAAHCVVNRDGAVQQDITFTAAETRTDHGGLGAANGVRVYFNSGYLGTTKDWTNWDLGIVVLDKPLGVNSTQAFSAEVEQLKATLTARRRSSDDSSSSDFSGNSGRHSRSPARGFKSPPGTVGYAASPKLDGTYLVSAGYPGDKPLGTEWVMTCSLTDDTPDSNVVRNRCPITNGQSGAGLIERRSNNGQARHYVRGVVSFEMCKSVCSGACCGGKASYNGVLKITPFFQDFIDSHRDNRPNVEEQLQVASDEHGLWL